MENWNLHIPEGVQDYLVDECYNKNVVENNLKEYFLKCGYSQIQTPTIEYYDVFRGIETIEQQNMLKFIDREGRILVMRPDITTPIARVAATKLNQSLPLKIFYVGNVFRYEQPQSGRQREFTQAGLELIGAKGPKADAEVISTAILSLKHLGLKDFKIDLGQVEFFKGIMQDSGLSTQDIEKLRRLIDKKNYIEIKEFIESKDMDAEIKDIIMKLPTLYGEPDQVINNASYLSDNYKSLKALDEIKSVCQILKDFGLEEYISLDLGMVQGLEYYTGIIFKGFAKGIGYTLCGGGRYDNLIGNFGQDMPATGFAIGIKRLLIALEKQGMLNKAPAIDYRLIFDDQNRACAFKLCTRMRERGYIVDMALYDEGMVKSEGIKNIIKMIGDKDIEIYKFCEDKWETYKTDSFINNLERKKCHGYDYNCSC